MNRPKGCSKKGENILQFPQHDVSEENVAISHTQRSQRVLMFWDLLLRECRSWIKQHVYLITTSSNFSAPTWNATGKTKCLYLWIIMCFLWIVIVRKIHFDKCDFETLHKCLACEWISPNNLHFGIIRLPSDIHAFNFLRVIVLFLNSKEMIVYLCLFSCWWLHCNKLNFFQNFFRNFPAITQGPRIFNRRFENVLKSDIAMNISKLNKCVLLFDEN